MVGDGVGREVENAHPMDRAIEAGRIGDIHIDGWAAAAQVRNRAAFHRQPALAEPGSTECQATGRLVAPTGGVIDQVCLQGGGIDGAAAQGNAHGFVPGIGKGIVIQRDRALPAGSLQVDGVVGAAGGGRGSGLAEGAVDDHQVGEARQVDRIGGGILKP